MQLRKLSQHETPPGSGLLVIALSANQDKCPVASVVHQSSQENSVGGNFKIKTVCQQ